MSRILGSLGETKVTQHLEQQGFSILKRNYQVREGEIDIIARKRELVVFVEVKTRAIETFGLSEAVTPSKQKKIIFTAKHFLAVHGMQDVVCRFDVALVEGTDLNIEYIPNAFSGNSW